MEKIEECSQCLQTITHPICWSCYLKQIDSWLKQVNFDKIARGVIIEKIKRTVPKDSLNETECILCGKENVGLCSYCFFTKAARALSELNAPKDFIDTFFATFSYVDRSEEIFPEVEHGNVY